MRAMIARAPGGQNMRIRHILACTLLLLVFDGRSWAQPWPAKQAIRLLWSVEDMVALVEAAEAKPRKRGPYKKRAA
jgi:hypothetical protein